MRVKLFACGLMSSTINAVHLKHSHSHQSTMPDAAVMLPQTEAFDQQEMANELFLPQFDAFDDTTNEMMGLAQVSEEDKSLSAQMFKYYNIAMDSIYGIGCRFTGCEEPTPMDLAKMWHLMKAHRKRTKITKITPTWPSPQLAVPAAPPANLPIKKEDMEKDIDDGQGDESPDELQKEKEEAAINKKELEEAEKAQALKKSATLNPKPATSGGMFSGMFGAQSDA